jgi:outer membrane protein TolC
MMKQIKLRYLAALFVAVMSVTCSFGQVPDSLSHYLQVAAQNNPGLKADFLAYKASLQKAPQAGAYADPELEMGFFLEPMDIIGGKQVAGFQLMQMFPWFGTKKAARTEAVHMAKMQFEKFRETRDNLYLGVYTQWYLLCSLQQQLINSRENRTWLTRLEELAIRKFASPPAGASSGYALPAPAPATPSSMGATPSSAMPGMSSMGGSGGGMAAGMSGSGGGMSAASMGAASGGMAEVLRVQLEIAEMDNRIESLLLEIGAEKARFNVLLGRPFDSDVQIPDSFGQASFLFDEQSARTQLERLNPMLGMIAEEELAYKAKGEMDRKMGYPMLGIGVQYMLNKKTDDPMFGMGAMNGKDMIMPMLSVSIPVYRNKYKARQRENELWRQSSRERYDHTRNTLIAGLYDAKRQLDDASGKIALYGKQAELAETMYNLALQAFVSGKSDMDDVIQVQRQRLDYRLKEAQAIATYNTMAASIRRYISFEEQ